jgi:hypothetical protein
VAAAVGLGRLDELLDLVGGQVFAGAQLRVWWALRRDCSIFQWLARPIAGSDSPRFNAPRDSNCSNNRHFLNNHRTERAAEAALPFWLRQLANPRRETVGETAPAP